MIVHALALLGSASGEIDAAALLEGFAKRFCRKEEDRVPALRDWKLSRWQVTEDRIARDVIYSVDAPIPKNDEFHLGKRGPIAGGTASVSGFTFDYEDPKQRDHSSMLLHMFPESLTSMSALEKVLRVKLKDRFPGGSTETGDGHVQHFIAHVTANAPIEISVTHFWSSAQRSTYWSVRCGTPILIARHSNRGRID